MKIELTKEQLIALVGKRKAAKAFPDAFKDEFALPEIKKVEDFIVIAEGEYAPGGKYDGRCFILSPNHHWNIIKRTIGGKWTTYLVPVAKEGRKHNPMLKLKAVSTMRKVAAKRKYTRRVKQA